MVQELTTQPTIFGRLGKGLAQGLAETVPKEIERNRLASGLQTFEKEHGNLTPIQQLARLSSIPGITPQMIQSFGDLAKQQAKGNALTQQRNSQHQPSPFPELKPKASAQTNETPSITKSKPLEEIQRGYIPPTQDEIFTGAGRRYNENPALYNNDPQQAIAAEEMAAIREEKRNEAYQRQHENLNKIQDNVKNRLNTQASRLNVEIPSNTYSKIEDKAIQATKPISDGGEGLTEQQAMRKYGDELDEVSRDYKKLDSIGDWGITTNTPSSTLRSIKQLQNAFEKRGDTENFADSLVAGNGLSPKFAYAIAEPVSRVSSLSKTIKSLPRLEPVETLFESKVPPDISIPKTLEIAPRLAEILKSDDKASPLAISYELEKKGYDPETWLEYVTEHQKELNLKANQLRQLEERQNLIGTWNDWWLSSWSGL